VIASTPTPVAATPEATLIDINKLMASTPPIPTPTATLLKIRIIKHSPKSKMDADELASVKKALKAINWSRNPDPKEAADVDYSAIVKILCKGRTTQSFPDLIWEAESNDYQPNNEKANDEYQAQLSDDFESGIRAKTEQEDAKFTAIAGPSPLTDGTFGVSLFVHDAIKAILNDPDSYKYISVSGPWRDSHDGKSCWLEKVHFRARNGLGGYVVDTASVWIAHNSNSGEETVLDVKLLSQESTD
jgi:hypothetical protein